MAKYYIVYKTTNVINGKFYIGAHRCSRLNDTYLGSGVVLEKAIKKYGKENFIREVLHVADNENQMFTLEKQIIKESMGINCYNAMPGGKGGFDHINSTNMHRGQNNSMHNEDIKKKVMESGAKTRAKDPEKYRRIAIENFKLASIANTGRKRPERSEPARIWSKEMWSKNKEFLRDRMSSNFELTSPDGMIYNTNRLKEFCVAHGLPYTTVWYTSIRNKPAKWGKSKGWICKKI